MKIRQTMPVILKDLDNGTHNQKSFILYTLQEGGQFSILVCTEDEASRLLNEYERSGTLCLPVFDSNGPRYEVIEPNLMIKANYADGARKHFKLVEMDDPQHD